MTRWLGGDAGPPRLAETLLRLVVGDSESREGMLGDLWEEYRDVAAEHSFRYASLWYWWSAVRLALRYAAARAKGLPRAHNRARVIATLRRGGALTVLARDVGYAARGLRRTRGLTASLVVMLGLGLGASTTIFGVLDAVVLRPLPFPEPHRLIRLSEISPQGVDFLVSEPNFADFRERASAVVDLADLRTERVSLSGDGGLERRTAGFTTSALFRVLGVRPDLGRSLTVADERLGANGGAVLLSSGLWRSRFGGDPGILGKTLRLDDGLFVVVGVMPKGLEILSDVDVWLARQGGGVASREDHQLQVYGRLRTDAQLSDAREEVARIAGALGERYPTSNRGWGVELTPLTDHLVGPRVRLVTVTLFSALGVLLLLIGANISNLLMARTSTRQEEFGVRSALGAGRWSVVRLLLAEGVLLGVMGATIGIGLAWVLLPLVSGQPELVPRMSDVAFDGWVLAFALLASAGEGVGIGLGSAVQAARWRLRGAPAGAGAGPSTAARRYRDVLVVGQVALAMTLLVVAGLVTRSFQRLQGVDTGFRTEGLMAVEVQLSPPPSPLELPGRVERILSALGGVPGVQAVAGTNMRYFDLSPRNFTEFGRVDAPLEDYVTADWRVVTPGYFETAGVPVRAGRVFDDPHVTSGEPVVVVCETLARILWPDQDAVGQRLRWETPEGIAARVIGVVGHVSDVHPGLPQVPSAYVPYARVPTRGLTFLLQSDAAPSDLATSVRQRIRQIDPGAAASQLRAVRERYVDVLALDRFLPAFLAVVAAVAVMLAGLGVYGLVAFTVARRSHEIGVRMAIGGEAGSIVGMLFRHGAVLVTAGVAIGAAAALAISRILSSLLFETEPTDPVIYLAVGAFLAVVGLVATYVPSRRATRVDPMKVLPA